MMGYPVFEHADLVAVPDGIRLTIVKDAKGGYHVWKDGKTTGVLCAGEMLEQVVTLLDVKSPNGTGYAMHTPEEWAEQDRARAERRAEADLNFHANHGRNS